MRGSVNLSILIGLLLLVAVPLASGGTSRARATIALADDSPVVVAGRGFARAERVTLRTTVNGRRFTRIVVAGRYGRFTARVANVDAECSPFAVSAVGERGSRAALRRIKIPPPCGPPIAP
jgi:hypothetical protein